ncbi:MAG TPA: hypothetical protein VMW42_00165, partial [Desulfatiglandales bacterium]|nr:hypothetical protein [Desulfatiglandales bacterium]
VLKNEIDEKEIPESVRPVVMEMRTQIDSLSKQLMDSGAIEGDLIGIIDENLGTYAKRSYRVFDDPGWAKKVPEDVRNRAKAFIRADFDLSEEEVLGVIDELLYKIEDSPIKIISKGSKIGAKAMSILKKRKVIPEEIRALWGEYKDAEVNYVKSVSAMSQFIANHKFLTEIKKEGMGKYFFDNPIVKEGESYSAKIALEGSKAFAPLNGIYTTKELKKAFEEASSVQSNAWWLQQYMKIVGISRYSKTVMSAMTHVRNLIGNTNIAIAQGHINPMTFMESTKATFKDFITSSDKEQREYIKHLIKIGVLNEDVRSGEMRDTIKDATVGDIDKIISPGTKGIVKGGIGIINNLYQAEDNVWKIAGFENEKKRYSKAYPEWSMEQVESKAAEIIRNVYPTYSLIPSVIKGLRRFPFAGPFVSFPAEIARTSYHTVKLIKEELSNEKTRSIGAKRLAGTLTAASMTTAISIASRYIIGLRDKDDEDLREFVPPWTENSNLLWMGRDEEKKEYTYMDMNYVDPYSYIKAPVMAFIRGDDWKERIRESIVEAMSPFVSEDILTSKLLDIKRNKKNSGAPVYNPVDDWNKQTEDIINHLWSGIEPGTITSMKRIYNGFMPDPTNIYGKKYNPKLEAIATVTGLRISSINIKKSLGFKAFKFSKDISDASILGRNKGKESHIK